MNVICCGETADKDTGTFTQGLGSYTVYIDFYTFVRLQFFVPAVSRIFSVQRNGIAFSSSSSDIASADIAVGKGVGYLNQGGNQYVTSWDPIVSAQKCTKKCRNWR